MSATPTVSVIIATYNRSRVLKHAIQSVIDSSLTDWELIVVGDHCTDDTESSVASFGDERIRFVNLPSNCGDQSGPNNHGIQLARGRYLAFLNHDDMYLPDHLVACTARLVAGADFVWAAAAVATDVSEPTPGALPGRFTLAGVPSATGYSPFSFYSASSWMFRREVAERVGPWPSPDRVYVSPSQAWLFRAWRAGVPLTFIRKVGVILLWSGTRPGSYANRDSLEHEILARWIKQDAMSLGRISEDAALTAESLRISNMYHSPLKAIARACLQPAYALQMAAGLHPHSLQMALRYGGRGGFIRHHRHLTGVR